MVIPAVIIYTLNELECRRGIATTTFRCIAD